MRQLLPEVLAELSLGSGKSGLSFKLSDLFPGLRRGLCPPPLRSPFWLLLCIHSVKVIPLTVSSTTMPYSVRQTLLGGQKAVIPDYLDAFCPFGRRILDPVTSPRWLEG